MLSTSYFSIEFESCSKVLNEGDFVSEGSEFGVQADRQAKKRDDFISSHCGGGISSMKDCLDIMPCLN